MLCSRNFAFRQILGAMNKKSQLDRFKEAARELGADDNEELFNEKLRKLAKQKPDDKKPSSD